MVESWLEVADKLHFFQPLLAPILTRF